ncbi:hypothetical protein [Micromonospora sp. NPDC005367]|uniref:hypothetical protein n=1 Tax=Micromonospora sp. NPDC005367 TaxID=3155590 RepID=UPI0033BF9C08
MTEPVAADRRPARLLGSSCCHFGCPAKVEQTWTSNEPAKVQIIACPDRVSTGSTIRRCKFDDPKPDTATLVRAGWRLRVYEVATGRELLDKVMPEDDQEMPVRRPDRPRQEDLRRGQRPGGAPGAA